jgi:anthranilate synthase component 2
VCLGHQCIGQAFGAQIVHAGEIMHGKTSLIDHNGRDIFSGIDNPFEATRYHSLVIEPATLPPCLEITARTVLETGATQEIMAVRHVAYPLTGVQFHPESILTRPGHRLLRNFLDDQATATTVKTRVA